MVISGAELSSCDIFSWRCVSSRDCHRVPAVPCCRRCHGAVPSTEKLPHATEELRTKRCFLSSLLPWGSHSLAVEIFGVSCIFYLCTSAGCPQRSASHLSTVPFHHHGFTSVLCVFQSAHCLSPFLGSHISHLHLTP